MVRLFHHWCYYCLVVLLLLVSRSRNAAIAFIVTTPSSSSSAAALHTAPKSPSLSSDGSGSREQRGRSLLPLRMSSSTSSTKKRKEIVVIRQPDHDFLQSKGVFDWSTWGCGVSKFPWTYDDNESCYLLAGQVTVTPTDPSGHGPAVTFGKGDFVTFPAGMSCTWDVIEPVQKHYTFF